MDVAQIELHRAFSAALHEHWNAEEFERLMTNAEAEPASPWEALRESNKRHRDWLNAFTLSNPFLPSGIPTALQALKAERALAELRVRYPDVYDVVERDPDAWLRDKGESDDA